MDRNAILSTWKMVSRLHEYDSKLEIIIHFHNLGKKRQRNYKKNLLLTDQSKVVFFRDMHDKFLRALF